LVDLARFVNVEEVFNMNTLRALIVDDDAAEMEVLRKLLQTFGITASLIDDPRDFPTAYHAFMPELILLELGMEKIDGIELLDFLGKQASRALIVIVSRSPESIVNVAHRLGREYGLNIAIPVAKPIDVKVLRERISECCRAVDTIPELRITEVEISDAIAQAQFFLDYQPKVDLGSCAVVGVEGQLRWQHPKHGKIHAERFLAPLANAGQLDMITNHILALAIQDTDNWCEYVPELSVSIKLSLASLRNPHLPERLERTVKSHHCEPGAIIFEVMNHFAQTPDNLQNEVMTRLLLMGFRFSIGELVPQIYQLLGSQRQKVPAAEIKVDASAILGRRPSDFSKTSIRTIISVAHRVSIKVVATNIADDATYDWLADAGCDFGQGPHICPALPPERMTQWLANDDLSHLDRTLTPEQLKTSDLDLV